MISYVDYKEKYLQEMDQLEDNFWGLEEQESIQDEIDKNSLIRVALNEENRVVGFIHAQVIGDLLEIHNILIKENYQKRGIGSHLLKEILEQGKMLGMKNSIANAVVIKGEYINSEKLLLNFGYKPIYRVNDYWEAIYPGYYCKQCDSNPCYCDNVVFLKSME